MAGISEAGHRWFMDRMKEQASAEQRKLVKDELYQLEAFFFVSYIFPRPGRNQKFSKARPFF